MNTTRIAMATRPIRPANANVPSRVDSDFRISCTGASSSRQHADAASERAQIARRAAGTGAHVRDVLDEMADDVARVAVGNGVVATALAGVGEAAARCGPAGYVEGGEVRDRHGGVAA